MISLERSIAPAALGLYALALWWLLHPYGGITHDATLYTLFALDRLHPGVLNNDLFLRFGSQDHYTVFTPIYAAAIAVLGLEHAASLLTLLFQSVLLVGAWLLARRFMSALAATLAVALLVAAPGEYGASDVFHVIEGFITPRMPAEALVVLALVAGLNRRYWIAALVSAGALALHPIIGCAGAALLALIFLAPARPRLVAAAAIAVALALALIPLGRLEGMWLFSVRITSSYLFLANWSSSDWARVVLPLTILAVGVLNGTDPLLRRVCAAALVMAAGGLLITGIFGDLLHTSLFIGAQAWRWLWLANLLAFVLAPVIVADGWRHGESGRVAILLLASAWILRNTTPALALVPLTLVCAAIPAGNSRQRLWQGLYLGACVLVGVALLLDLVERLFYLPGFDPTLPQLPQQVRATCEDGVIPGILAFTAWQVLHRSRSAAGMSLVAGPATLACAGLLPLAWGEWTHIDYTPELVAQTAPWRAGLPAGAEILADNPVFSWYLLERPNYWSTFQAAGAIFSRDKALLLQQRGALLGKAAQASSDAIPGTRLPEGVVPLSQAGMRAACTDAALGYIVSWLPVAPTPYPAVTFAGRKAHGQLYFYRCADLHS
jgi:hypothetical protein